MTWESALIFVSAGALRGVPARAPPIEKSCCNSRLDHGADGAKPSDPKKSGARTPVPASRNDTVFDVSFWNGPRLGAAFVAQVLGQVIEAPSEGQRRAALSAYGAQRGARPTSIDDRA